MVILGIALAVTVLILVVHWWTEGYIGALEGVFLVIVFGGLLTGVFSSNTMPLRLLALIPLVLCAIWAGYLAKTGSLRSYYIEKAKQYELAIDMDPENFAARTKLAETLHELGDIDRAIAELRIAIETNPKSALQERNLLNLWLQDEHLKQTRNVVCFRCRHENERGLKHCVKCGEELRYSFDPADTFKKNIHQFIIVSAGLAMAAISVALVSIKYAWLPIAFAALIVIGRRMHRRP